MKKAAECYFCDRENYSSLKRAEEIYEQGIGTDPDLEKAAECLRLMAKQGEWEDIQHYGSFFTAHSELEDREQMRVRQYVEEWIGEKEFRKDMRPSLIKVFEESTYYDDHTVIALCGKNGGVLDKTDHLYGNPYVICGYLDAVYHFEEADIRI